MAGAERGIIGVMGCVDDVMRGVVCIEMGMARWAEKICTAVKEQGSDISKCVVVWYKQGYIFCHEFNFLPRTQLGFAYFLPNIYNFMLSDDLPS